MLVQCIILCTDRLALSCRFRGWDSCLADFKLPRHLKLVLDFLHQRDIHIILAGTLWPKQNGQQTNASFLRLVVSFRKHQTFLQVKLTCIVDDISYGRFKSAQNTVDRHLKKHPKSQPALVLRMVLSEKTGGSDKEVVNAFEAVRATGELTGRSAWWVGNTLRSIQRRELQWLIRFWCSL